MEKPHRWITLEKNWLLSQIEKNLEMECDCPSTVFENCLQNGLIPDPFYGLNEFHVKWVYESDWVFSTHFHLTREQLTYQNFSLVCAGLDTLAEIYLNGQLVGESKNMHRVVNYPIKQLCVAGENMLRIIFRSPTKWVEKKIQSTGIKLHTGMESIPGGPYLRKAQYAFGWDWGPQLPDIGIWKPIEIHFWDTIRISNYHLKQIIDFPPSSIPITQLPSAKSAILTFNVNLSYTNLNLPEKDKFSACNCKIELYEGVALVSQQSIDVHSNQVQFELLVESPKLWWTHDVGLPFLYDLKISLYWESQLIDILEEKVGIRELRLINQSDQWGTSFYFLLNTIPLFAKGANWIPVDSFLSRGYKQNLYQMNLDAAKKANFNTIRVWGGGIYEIDAFYNWCDEAGLLVWQDFPFACALYPPDSSFTKEIIHEARDNIQRLRNHPSLALWCGNNEIENLWIALKRQVSWGKWRILFKKGYTSMFYDILPQLIRELDPQTAYWPSSPTSHATKPNFGYLGSNSPRHGDSHFWLVWHGGFPFKAYRRFFSRFMSEFGFESFPNLATIDAFCEKRDQEFYSPVMENHQKNRAGNKKIFTYMKKRFRIPSSFEKQIVLSQITQAEAIEYGVEHWRRHRNDQHCMGSLYWQLNDCWPVASWSSIDYFGRWKALHYFAKRFYSPIFPSIEENSANCKFWITNDLPQFIQGTLEYRVLTTNGKLIMHGSHRVNCPPLTSQMIKSLSLLKERFLYRKNIPFVFVTYTPHNRETPEKKDRLDLFRFLTAPKKYILYDPAIQWQISGVQFNESDALVIDIDLHVKNPAFYIHLQTQTFDFEATDNYFSLLPDLEKKITMRIPLSQKTSSGNIFLEYVRKSRQGDGFDQKIQNRLKKEISFSSLFDLY